MSDAFISGHPFPKNYSEKLLTVSSGKGAYVQDISGKKYLDFGSGISVNSLGYGRKDLAKVAAAQMKKLIHISNLYATEPALACARKLIDGTPYTAVHFGNSGAEANEAAIKYARLYAGHAGGADKINILSFTNGFHGRTLGALSITPKAKYKDPFGPMVPGTNTSTFNDVDEVHSILDESYAAVFVEVVQGEGGLDVMTEEFAQALNETCEKHNVILVADEVQTGLGRTGYTFASDMVGLKPDIITLAKPLAGGLPLSATLIPAKINDLLEVGLHGTTFGGGPVTTAVACAVLDIVCDKSFLEGVKATGEYLRKALVALGTEFDSVGEVKGAGMLTGFQYSGDLSGLLAKAQANGLLLLSSGTDRVRIAPPCVITNKEIDSGIEILREILKGDDNE